MYFGCTDLLLYNCLLFLHTEMKLRILALIFKLICSKNTGLWFVAFQHFYVISMIYNKEDQHMASIFHSADSEIVLKSTIILEFSCTIWR